MNKIRCAVAGATGVVGQSFLRLLQDHPNFEVVSICASEARIGKKLGESLNFAMTSLPEEFLQMPLESMNIDTLKHNDVSIVFSALPASTAVEFELEAVNAGCYVFSNASAHRMDSDVPILIPEINADHLALVKVQKKKSPNGGFLVTNANCTTTGLVLALVPIVDVGIKELVMASYQALSGAGYPGYSAMEMSANCIPYIAGEEKKVEIEVAKIFGHQTDGKIEPVDWSIYPHCVRVPSIVGHLISVHVVMENKVDSEEILKRFNNFKPSENIQDLPTAPIQPVIYLKEPNRPQPRLDADIGEPERARGMAISVGRLTVQDEIIRFMTLSHNLIRGAAGGSILNAELALRKGLL